MNEILMEGTSVMCVGMGTVFTFLCILILAMNIMSKAIARLNILYPELVAQTAGGSKAKKTSSNDEEIAVAVLAAMFGKKK